MRDHPSRVETLRSLSFIFSRLQPEWNTFIETLTVYLSIQGHVDVPSSFTVRLHDPDYGMASWGLDLGSYVSMIRSRGLYISNRPARILQLNNLGFIWDKQVGSQRSLRCAPVVLTAVLEIAVLLTTAMSRIGAEATAQ